MEFLHEFGKRSGHKVFLASSFGVTHIGENMGSLRYSHRNKHEHTKTAIRRRTCRRREVGVLLELLHELRAVARRQRSKVEVRRHRDAILVEVDGDNLEKRGNRREL